MKFYLYIFIFYFIFISKSYAYLDPGTGSIILQAILAFIAGAAATVSLWWGNLKMFFKKVFKSEKKDSDKKDNETNLKP
jgi:hypothetical protein